MNFLVPFSNTLSQFLTYKSYITYSLLACIHSDCCPLALFSVLHPIEPPQIFDIFWKSIFFNSLGCADPYLPIWTPLHDCEASKSSLDSWRRSSVRTLFLPHRASPTHVQSMSSPYLKNYFCPSHENWHTYALQSQEYVQTVLQTRSAFSGAWGILVPTPIYWRFMKKCSITVKMAP